MKKEEITNNEFLRHFEIRINKYLATIEYTLQEKKIFLTKLNIPEEVKDNKLKHNFIQLVLEKLADEGMKVVPTCPKIKPSESISLSCTFCNVFCH